MTRIAERSKITKVVLIGDSIQMGYQPLVVTNLQGWAEVWGPSENCRHSLWALEHFNQWVAGLSSRLLATRRGWRFLIDRLHARRPQSRAGLSLLQLFDQLQQGKDDSLFSLSKDLASLLFGQSRAKVPNI